MQVPRVQNITNEIFINEYLLPKKPVIITDGMKDWDVEKFQPEYLKKTFGEHFVQVYNDLFDLQTIDSLATYLDGNFNRKEEEGLSREYIRWYTKLKDVDFYWSDEVFAELKPFWSHPYFVPSDSLAVPYCEGDARKSITEFRFPYKGLFISGKGSRTRLHKDPFNSNAVLCQFYGEKKIFLYSPDKEKYVMKGSEFVDLKHVDHEAFPEFSKITFDYEDTLKPGEIILFPAGWFHDVTCVTDSISITWNFIHQLELNGLYNHIQKNPEDDQLEILRFFLKDKIADNASASEIISFYKNSLVSASV